MAEMYDSKIDQIADDSRPGGLLKHQLDMRLVNSLLREIDAINKPNSEIVVLEIGTGTGTIGEQLLKNQINYIGIEPTRTLRIAAEQRLTKYKQLTQIYDDRLPKLDSVFKESVDVCLMLHVLEHAPNYVEAHDWLTAIRDRLRFGGKLIIICPNYFDYQSYFFDGDWSHSWVSTTRRIALLGRDAGFNVLRASDTRANTSRLTAKAVLCVISKIFPTQLVNWLGRKFLHVDYLGMGIQAALFWRNSLVVLEKK